MSFSEFITIRFNQKRMSNPNYSFRAFCRDLQMSPGRMTNFIKGREYPSPKTIEKLCTNLKLSTPEIEHLQKIVEEDKYLRRGRKFSKKLTAEEFRQISDWKTWSIFSYLQSSNLDPSPSEISKGIKIKEHDVQESLNKLENVGLIKKDDQAYSLVAKNVTTTNDVPSSDLRKVHKEFIGLAIKSLDSVPVSERDITGITMCIDKSRMKELKSLIAEFRARFNNLAESPIGNDLYQLNIQFFPIRDYEEEQQ